MIMFKQYIDQLKQLNKETYPKEKRESDKLVHLWGYYITRPISMLITPIFIKLGVGANNATFISLSIGLSSLFYGCNGRPLYAVILYNIFLIFDALDGNLARYYGSTKQGELFDAIVGNILNFLFIPSVAIGIQMFDIKDLCVNDIIFHQLTLIALLSSLLLTISMLIAKDVKIIYQKKITISNNNQNKSKNLLHYLFRNSFGMAVAGPFSIVTIIFNVFDIFVIYNLIISFIVLLFSIYSSSYIEPSKSQ
jgi:phosphatidylglycerophosphate synthase